MTRFLMPQAINSNRIQRGHYNNLIKEVCTKMLKTMSLYKYANANILKLFVL